MVPLAVFHKFCSRGGDCRPHLVSGYHRSRCLASSLAASASAYPGSSSLAHVCCLFVSAGNAPGVRAALYRRRTALLQSIVGWNDPPPGVFAFGEPAPDPHPSLRRCAVILGAQWCVCHWASTSRLLKRKRAIPFEQCVEELSRKHQGDAESWWYTSEDPRQSMVLPIMLVHKAVLENNSWRWRTFGMSHAFPVLCVSYSRLLLMLYSKWTRLMAFLFQHNIH